MPFDQLAGVNPARVWVTRGDQFVVVVYGPQVIGDTLVGYVNGEFAEMPAADFKQVLVRRTAMGRTMALVTIGTLGFAGFVYLLRGTIGDPTPPACDSFGTAPGCS